MVLNGDITLAANGDNSDYNNLKWEEIESLTARKSIYLTNGMGTSSLVSKLELLVGDTEVYYIAVWLSENGKNQLDTDKGSFGGMVMLMVSIIYILDQIIGLFRRRTSLRGMRMLPVVREFCWLLVSVDLGSGFDRRASSCQSWS